MKLKRKNKKTMVTMDKLYAIYNVPQETIEAFGQALRTMEIAFRKVTYKAPSGYEILKPLIGSKKANEITDLIIENYATKKKLHSWENKGIFVNKQKQSVSVQRCTKCGDVKYSTFNKSTGFTTHKYADKYRQDWRSWEGGCTHRINLKGDL